MPAILRSSSGIHDRFTKKESIGFIYGRNEVITFLTRKLVKELDYRLMNEMWAVLRKIRSRDQQARWTEHSASREGLCRKINMEFLKKDDVALKYEDTGADLPPMVLIHGCGCDHSSLAPQAEFFRNSHRVVSVDLRGHGESDAPHQDYTMAAFADDLVWLCKKLVLTRPIIVGHSMGGNVGLELAARYPDIPSSLVMIDSVMLPRRHCSILCTRSLKHCRNRITLLHIGRRSQPSVLQQTRDRHN
jgi:predicted esterase